MNETKSKWVSKIGQSQSFNEAEINLMDDLLTRLRAGTDVSMLLRHQSFANLSRKFMQMRQKVAQQKLAKTGGT